MKYALETTARPEMVDALLIGSGSTPLQHGVRVADVARRQNVSLAKLFAAVGIGAEFSREVVATVELEIKYAGYFAKERQAADRLTRMSGFVLPADAPYEAMRTLSVESRQKLAARRPRSLSQAASIPGVTPADLQNLILEIERLRSANAE